MLIFATSNERKAIMQLDHDILSRLTWLARLSLDEGEEREMTRHLVRMTDWLGQLQEVPTQGVEPQITMSHVTNRLREDVPATAWATGRALETAPAHDSNYFHVPKYVREGGDAEGA